MSWLFGCWLAKGLSTAWEKSVGVTYPFGHLCYENTPSCDMWKESEKFHIEKATKQVEELFEIEEKGKQIDKLCLRKLIKVSDPDNWYYSNKIICKLRHPDFWNNLDSEKDTVRIIFYSYDDFAMYRDFNYYDLDNNWKFCKEHYFDTLPNIINVEWLYRHGYVPF